VDSASERDDSLRLRVASDMRELRRTLESASLKTYIYGPGLEFSQVDTLDFLAEHPWRAGDLAGALGIDASTLTRAIDRLTAKGLVMREADELDGRGVRIVLTEAGRWLQTAITDRRIALMGDLLEDFGVDEQRTFAELIERFTKAVQREAEELANDPQARTRVMRSTAAPVTRRGVRGASSSPEGS
jgi:DNA-binding MarR family transcriptional regulator